MVAMLGPVRESPTRSSPPAGPAVIVKTPEVAIEPVNPVLAVVVMGVLLPLFVCLRHCCQLIAEPLLKLVRVLPQVMQQAGEAGFLIESKWRGKIGGEVGDVPQVVGQGLPAFRRLARQGVSVVYDLSAPSLPW